MNSTIQWELQKNLLHFFTLSFAHTFNLVRFPDRRGQKYSSIRFPGNSTAVCGNSDRSFPDHSLSDSGRPSHPCASFSCFFSSTYPLRAAFCTSQIYMPKLLFEFKLFFGIDFFLSLQIVKKKQALASSQKIFAQ